MSPGARIKVLHTKPDIRRRTFLLELAPGAEAENYAHDDDEGCYVISGDICFGDKELRAGDDHLAQRGSRHGPSRSNSGCL
ncbi:cupin domain-containing protein [Rhizobium sp. C4]|uniref:cupin domain-containing protein n=1 Tax=Rhizobium sp. C4 TaxID=1349800 RepID=UPI003FA7C7DB